MYLETCMCFELVSFQKYLFVIPHMNKNSNSTLGIIPSLLKFLYVHLYHTPPEGLCGSEKSSRLMTFTQPFYGISGTQNRKNQNFLTRTFFLIAILRHPIFYYCFYYIAMFELSCFLEIFTRLLVIFDWI